MPIEFDCTGCGNRLRVRDEDAGKKAECPECGTILDIPLPAQPDHPPQEPPGQQAAAPGAGRAAEAPPLHAGRLGEEDLEALGIRPTRIELDDALSQSWRIFKGNLGMVVGSVWLVIVAEAIASRLVEQLQRAGSPMAPLMHLASLALAVYLQIGLTIVLLRIARGEGASAADLISGGRYFWRMVGASICFGVMVMLGLLALVIPAIVLALMFGQYGNLIIDRDVGVSDSLRLSRVITRGNKITLLALACVSSLLVAAGFLLCGVGAIVAIPYVVLLFPVAYLQMTGQLGEAEGIEA